ncbi:peptidoglycan-binding protein [Salipaludibacillus keqinensis]|nr:peptidoglycan-binding protein [Salipaludibacillus keqinensis]
MNLVIFSAVDFSKQVEAADSQTITSIQPVGATTIDAGLDGGLGFEFPNFNNGASFEDVEHDIDLLVQQDGEWISIVNNAASGWVYDDNFGNWWEGPGGYWFNPVEETMQLRIASKTNPDVFVEYTFNVIPADTQVITSMAPAGPTSFDVSPSGGTGFEFPRFNNGATFRDVQDDVALFVNQDDEWVSIDNNADSGWIYDNNFGNWWEGPGGYWFDPVEETTQVRVASKTNPDVFVDYTLTVTLPVRNSHTITNFDGRSTFEADDNGAIGIPIPRIDGSYATLSEVDNFVYEVKVDGEWVNILDSSATGFSYAANGYNRMSSANQWGYWTDYIFGLWFQPIQEDMELRIGYPLDGEKDGDIGDNYVEYQFTGNPDAYRPDEVALDDIQIGTSEDATIEGWDLVWNDEFEGTELDESKWNYDTGYYLDDDPGTWGWGNNELQHYTDSEENVFVEDGKLNIVAFEEPASFPQDPDRVAPYSSGKITTQDKFTFKYGRIDFSAKLPAVTAAWPALWMMPNDDVYGGWASSGEIDVMEARGRVPNETSGAIHFGGEWPGNTYLAAEQTFEEGVGIDTDYHDYTLIWEEDMLSWYVNGEFFFKVSKEEWFSAADRENPYAPFDQDFYVIMNLALGGWFDGGREPDVEDLPVSMQVDYVRVYKDENADHEEPGEPTDPGDGEDPGDGDGGEEPGDGDEETPEEDLEVPYKDGDTGEEIREMKQKLTALGFGNFPTNPSENYDSVTSGVVSDFQDYYGLEVTGEADQETLDLLDSILNSVFTDGQSAPEIKQLKLDLTLLGFGNFPTNPSENYGSVTMGVVADFQEANNLVVNGIADPVTLAKISELVGELSFKDGDSGEEIKWLKQDLTKLGFGNFPAEPSENYGLITASVVSQFQRYYGLEVTGEANQQTLNLIRDILTSVYTDGNTAPEIRQLKVDLTSLGFGNFPVNPSQNYGPVTMRVVSDFQSAHDLAVNGIADPVTLAKIAELAMEIPYENGDTGKAVKLMKQHLSLLGFGNFPADPSELFGSVTSAVVLSFQEYYGLDHTAVADQQTLDFMNELFTSVYTDGNSAPEIRELKLHLTELGFGNFPSNPSENYGPVTSGVVKQFQEAHDLAVNGIADPVTLAKIEELS